MTSRIPAATLYAVLLAAGLLLSAENERLVIFSENGRSEVAVSQVGDLRYVELAPVIASEGSFSSKFVRNGFRIEIGKNDVELRTGEKQVRVGRTTVALVGPIIGAAEQSQIPLANVAEVLRLLLKKPAALREGGRLFIGNAADFVATEYRRGDPGNVVLSFRHPVNPTVSTDEGKVTLIFKQEPVLMNSVDQQFPDSKIKRLQFAEAQGTGVITLSGSGSLSAHFEDDNRKIVITAAPAPAVVATSPAEAPKTAPESATPAIPGESVTESLPPGTKTEGGRTYVVAIDPAHGGSDAGVRFSEKLLEKDLSSSLAEKLRAELANRGISSIVLREGEHDVSADQRAETANAARVTFYVGLHAGQMGTGVRIFSPLVGTPASSSLFTAWQRVQEPFAERSVRFSAAVAAQLGQKKVPARQLAANTGPVMHLASAAIAVELAPSEGGDDETLQSASYQQKVAQAIAMAIADERAKP